MSASLSGADRALLPDLLRAFALVGIAVVNVMIFAWPMMQGYHAGAMDQPRDFAAHFLVAGLFMAKAYPLFAMMFGVGLVYQQRAAQRIGKPFAPRYFRRLAGLYILGLLHFAFLFIGDILMMYAITGCLLFLARNMSVKHLVRYGVLLIALNAMLLAMLAGMMWMGEKFAPEQIAMELANDPTIQTERKTFGVDGFWDASVGRLSLMPIMQFNGLLIQGLSTLGFMLLGLAAARSGVIEDHQAPLWKKCRYICLPIGLVGSFFGGWIIASADSSQGSDFLTGTAILFTFSFFSSMGYAGVIAALSGGGSGPVKRFIARAGGTTLSAYLLQSLVMSLIFSAYGLGLYARLGAFEATLIGLAVGVLSIIVVALLRKWLARGPMEHLLRRLTYWGEA